MNIDSLYDITIFQRFIYEYQGIRTPISQENIRKRSHISH